jgi:TolB-like protein/Tfp pilus assembly protein PilF
MNRLLHELRRRNIFRVAGVYAVVGWLLAQVAGTLENAIGLPDWFDGFVVATLVIGFPIAILLAWAFEMTPQGVKRTEAVAEGESVSAKTGQRLDYVIVAGLVLVGSMVVWQQMTTSSAPKNATARMEASIAVLPFVDMSANRDQEYFADGLSEEILNVLAQSGALQVAGRTSSFQYKGQNKDLRAIGETLGVAHILEGSVRTDGDALRITAQLIKAKDGFHLWSATYDRKLEDIFQVQEEIANAIGEALSAPMGVQSQKLKDNRTDNPEAYKLYLEGKALWMLRFDNLLPAREKLERAVKMEPDFAAAWAALSLVYEVIPLYFNEEQDQGIMRKAYRTKTIRTARRAVELAPDLAVALHAWGNALRMTGQWVAAEDAYRRALAIEPDDHATLEDYSEMLIYLGAHEKGLKLARRALELDPFNPLYRWSVARGLRSIGKQNEAIVMLALLVGNWPYATEMIMSIQIEAGEYDEALATLKKYGSFSPKIKTIYLALIEQAKNPQPGFQIPEAANSIWVLVEAHYAALGPEHLLDMLERYAALGLDINVGPMQDTATLASVRGNPRFKQLVEALDFPAYWRERGWPKHCQPVGDDDFECT